VADLDVYVHGITWLVYSKETFLQHFYGRSRRILYHIERSVSLTHVILKKKKKRKENRKRKKPDYSAL